MGANITCVKGCYVLLRLWKKGESGVITDTQLKKLQKSGGEHFTDDNGKPIAVTKSRREKLVIRNRINAEASGVAFAAGGMSATEKSHLKEGLKRTIIEEMKPGLIKTIVAEVMANLEATLEISEVEEEEEEEEEEETPAPKTRRKKGKK